MILYFIMMVWGLNGGIEYNNEYKTVKFIGFGSKNVDDEKYI